MVQINLLPSSAKKQQQRKMELGLKLEPLIFIAIGIIVSIGIVWALLGVRISMQRKQLSQLDQEMQSLKSSLRKLNKLEQDKKLLGGKLEFLSQQLKKEIIWAENLNHLSNLVPEGIWLKKVELETEKKDNLSSYVGWDINAAVVSLYDEEMMDLIGKFMTALKQDQVFSEQFSEIKLISSKRGKFQNIAMMDFNLFCQFR